MWSGSERGRHASLRCKTSLQETRGIYPDLPRVFSGRVVHGRALLSARSAGQGIGHSGKLARADKRRAFCLHLYEQIGAVALSNALAPSATNEEIARFMSTGTHGIFYSATPEEMESLLRRAGLE